MDLNPEYLNQKQRCLNILFLTAGYIKVVLCKSKMKNKLNFLSKCDK